MTNAATTLRIRSERVGEEAIIYSLTRAAFEHAAHTGHNEHHIVDALREAGVLTLSLVGELEGVVVGHVAASPVRIDGEDADWLGIGPVSVLPTHQGKGIGSALMRAVVDAAKARGHAGCVLLGDPVYYARFGFVEAAPLVLPEVPPEYFQALHFTADRPAGVVHYHAAFDLPEGDRT